MAVPTETAPAELASWERGPAHPLLARGVVHVWRADLETVDDAVLRSLSADEGERAAKGANSRVRAYAA